MQCVLKARCEVNGSGRVAALNLFLVVRSAISADLAKSNQGAIQTDVLVTYYILFITK